MHYLYDRFSWPVVSCVSFYCTRLKCASWLEWSALVPRHAAQLLRGCGCWIGERERLEEGVAGQDGGHCSLGDDVVVPDGLLIRGDPPHENS